MIALGTYPKIVRKISTTNDYSSNTIRYLIRVRYDKRGDNILLSLAHNTDFKASSVLRTKLPILLFSSLVLVEESNTHSDNQT